MAFNTHAWLLEIGETIVIELATAALVVAAVPGVALAVTVVEAAVATAARVDVVVMPTMMVAVVVMEVVATHMAVAPSAYCHNKHLSESNDGLWFGARR